MNFRDLFLSKSRRLQERIMSFHVRQKWHWTLFASIPASFGRLLRGIQASVGRWHLGHIPDGWCLGARCTPPFSESLQTWQAPWWHESLEGSWCNSLDILMCCHGHAQPLQPVASAHLWGRHHAGVALTKPELEVGCLRGDDFGCWIQGEGGMLLAGHHMEPPTRTGTTLKWKMMKDVDGNRHVFGEGWKQLNADLKLHSGLCAHGLFEYWLDRSAKAVSRLGTHLI